MAGGRVLFFSAPCGFSKTALAEALLRGQNVLHLSAGDEGFALPPADGRWRVLLLDDLQNMQDENDWNALCELIHSGADRRFVLLSPWRASGLSDRLPVQRNGKILPCAVQSNTIKPPVRLSNRRLFRREWRVLLCRLPRKAHPQSCEHRPAQALCIVVCALVALACVVYIGLTVLLVAAVRDRPPTL